MKTKKLLVVGNNAALIVCEDTRLDILAVSKDRKTVVLGDQKSGVLYTNDIEAAKAFVKEDAQNGGELAVMLYLIIASSELKEIETSEIICPML